MSPSKTPTVVYQDEYFRIEQSAQIPGHLTIFLKAQPKALSDVPFKALEQLGPLLARAMKAIQDVIQPDRIYVLRFGEELEALHFHLFPRTQGMAELWAKTYPQQTFGGGTLFDWIRQPEILSQLVFPLTCTEAVSRFQSALQRRPA